MQEEIEFHNQEGAYNYIINRLKKQRLLENHERENKGRHIIINTYLKEPWNKIYMVFKREHFHTFSNMFYFNFSSKPENEKYKDKEGESLNKGAINLAIKEDAVLIFIYPDKKMKWIYPAQFKMFAEKWDLINEQDKANIYKQKNYTGKLEAVNEITYSVPIDFLKNLDFEELLPEEPSK